MKNSFINHQPCSSISKPNQRSVTAITTSTVEIENTVDNYRITTEDGAGIENDDYKKLRGISQTVNVKNLDKNAKMKDVRLTQGSKDAIRKSSL